MKVVAFISLFLKLQSVAYAGVFITKLEGITNEGEKCSYYLQPNAVTIRAEGKSGLTLGLFTSLPLLDGFFEEDGPTSFSYRDNELIYKELLLDANGQINSSTDLKIISGPSLEHPTEASLNIYYSSFPAASSQFTCYFN